MKFVVNNILCCQANISSISLQDCFDKNLTSDLFVSVWKLKFWASVIIREYIWTFGKYLEFGNIVNISSLFTSQFFCFHFLSKSSKEGSVLGANLLIELLRWEVNQGLQSV